jgi:hypothetical protein
MVIEKNELQYEYLPPIYRSGLMAKSYEEKHGKNKVQ